MKKPEPVKKKKNGRDKAPAFQWYAMDWLTDVNLRICSRETRADWADLLNYMFLSDERGKLKIQGRPMTKSDIQNLLKLSDSEFDKTFNELIRNGVMKQDSDGVYYSRRMVKDEEVRKIHAECGKLGGNPKLKKKEPIKDNLIDNLNQTPSSSSSSSDNSNDKSLLYSESDKKISFGKVEEIYEVSDELLDFIDKNCPTVKKMIVPLSVEESIKLRAVYPSDLCRDIFLQMENHKDLVKKYRSTYLTALNWLKRRNDSNPTTNNDGRNGPNGPGKPGKPNFTTALREF